MDNDDRYPIVLLVSGGIGVTPCQSVGKHLLHAHANEGRKLDCMHFCWAVPHHQMVKSIPPPTWESDHVITDPSVLATNIYVTRSSSKDHDQDHETAATSTNNTVDYYEIHSGRPDLEAIFRTLKEKAQENSTRHIAVVACGPSSLLQQVRENCRNHSDSPFLGCGGCFDGQGSGVTFDLHEEIFEY